MVEGWACIIPGPPSLMFIKKERPSGGRAVCSNSQIGSPHPRPPPSKRFPARWATICSCVIQVRENRLFHVRRRVRQRDEAPFCERTIALWINGAKAKYGIRNWQGCCRHTPAGAHARAQGETGHEDGDDDADLMIDGAAEHLKGEEENHFQGGWICRSWEAS